LTERYSRYLELTEVGQTSAGWNLHKMHEVIISYARNGESLSCFGRPHLTQKNGGVKPAFRRIGGIGRRNEKEASRISRTLFS
jgi:hypothetical protein